MRDAVAWLLVLLANLDAVCPLLLFPDGEAGASWRCPFPRRPVRCSLLHHIRQQRAAGERPAICLWDANTAEHPSRLSQLHDPQAFVWDRNCTVGRSSSLPSTRLFALAGDEYWEALSGYLQDYEQQGLPQADGPLPYLGLISMEASCYKPQQQRLLAALPLRGLDLGLVLSDPPAAAAPVATSAAVPVGQRSQPALVPAGPRFLRWSYGSTWQPAAVLQAWRAAGGGELPFSLDTKTEWVSMIVSAKVFTPGHVLRQTIAASLREGRLVSAHGGGVHLYGPADRVLPAGPAGKGAALSPYRYSIVMENCLAPRYFTEKLLDALLAGAVPLYYGPAWVRGVLGWGDDADASVPGTTAARAAAAAASSGNATAAAAGYGEAVLAHALARRIPVLPFQTPEELASLLATPALRDAATYAALAASGLPRAVAALGLPHAVPDDWLWNNVFSCAYHYYWGLKQVVPGKHCV